MFVIKFVRTVVMVNIIKLLLQKTANMSIFLQNSLFIFKILGYKNYMKKFNILLTNVSIKDAFLKSHTCQLEVGVFKNCVHSLML